MLGLTTEVSAAHQTDFFIDATKTKTTNNLGQTYVEIPSAGKHRYINGLSFQYANIEITSGEQFHV